MGARSHPKLEHARMDGAPAAHRREDRTPDRRTRWRDHRRGLDVDQSVQAARGGARASVRSDASSSPRRATFRRISTSRKGCCITSGVAARCAWPSRIEIESAITDDVAVVMLTHVNYRTGRMYDLRAHYRAGARARGDHALGSLALDGRRAGRSVGCERGSRRGLRLQISQRRSRCAGVSVRLHSGISRTFRLC